MLQIIKASVFVPGDPLQSSLMKLSLSGAPSSERCSYALAGNAKGESITILLTSCLAGLESAVRLLTVFVFICKTD